MSIVEAFTGIRYGRGLAALIVGACLCVSCAAGFSTGASRTLVAASSVVASGVCALAAVYLSRVQVALNERGLAYRAGLGRWQRYEWAHITTLERTEVTTPAVFGIGVDQSRATLRYLVGAGPTVHLRTRAGGDVWLSVPDTLTAARLQTYRQPPTQ